MHWRFAAAAEEASDGADPPREFQRLKEQWGVVRRFEKSVRRSVQQWQGEAV